MLSVMLLIFFNIAIGENWATTPLAIAAMILYMSYKIEQR